MKAVLILHLAVLGLIEAKAEPKILELELSKVAVVRDEPAVQSELAERDLSLQMLKFRVPSEYVVKIQVGTPKQTQWLGVHTASSLTWITYRYLANTPSYPYFDPKLSKAFYRKEDLDFIFKHPDDELDKFAYTIRENVSLNHNRSITDMILGAVPQTKNNSIGRLGLVAHSPRNQLNHPTFLDYLRAQGLIGRRAYSLNFHPDNYHGQILFGGIDTTKFIGELAVLTGPPDPSNGKVEGFFVGLSGVDIVTSASKPVQVSVPAEGMASLLDSGLRVSFLPQEVVSQIADNVGAFHDGIHSELMIDCTHKRRPNPQARVTFTLPRADGGAPVRINIPLADLAIEGDDEGEDRARVPAPNCLFGIQANSLLISPKFADTPTNSFAVFGQIILRHLYIVADTDKDQIAVAPVNPDPGPLANIVKLTASSDISALRGVDSPNEQGQAPPRAPEDEATDMQIDKLGNSEVVGAGESGYLGTVKARGFDEVGTSVAAMLAGGSPAALSSRRRDRGRVS